MRLTETDKWQILLEARDKEIASLKAQIEIYNNALESACEQRNDSCPISETGYCGAYPEWCNAVFSDIDGDANLTCRIKESESSMECWKKYYLGEILCE